MFFFRSRGAGNQQKNGKCKKNTFFLTFGVLVFIPFLVLFGFLFAAPAAEWSLKTIEISLVFVGESVCAPFSAALEEQENRDQHLTKTEAKKQRKTDTGATPENIKNTFKKHPKIIKNCSPEGVLGGPRASWPQGRRQEPPKIDFGGLRAPKKQLWTRPRAPKKNFGLDFHIFAPPQGGPISFNPPPSRPGGARGGGREAFWLNFGRSRAIFFILFGTSGKLREHIWFKFWSLRERFSSLFSISDCFPEAPSRPFFSSSPCRWGPCVDNTALQKTTRRNTRR